jgi:hypothetical protein
VNAWPRFLAWAAVAALALPPLACPTPRQSGPAPVLLLGPFAELWARVQWLRFQAANRRGEEARALELAESALALDPRASEGWQTLAGHLVFDLAAREREPVLARRQACFQAGLAVLRRGAENCQRPAELELYRGLVLVAKAESDPALDPGGAPALLLAAAEAFERAARLGDERAAELAPQVRAEAGRAE